MCRGTRLKLEIYHRFWFVEEQELKGQTQVAVREVICELVLQKGYCQVRGPYSYNPVPSEMLGMHT